MLDIQYIRENRELVQEKSRQKLVDIDIDQLLGFDEERRTLLGEVEALRKERNELSARSNGGRPSDEDIAYGRRLKDDIGNLEHRLDAVERALNELLKKVPNMPTDDTPVGSSEDENVVLRTVGDRPEFTFTPLSHEELMSRRGWLDKERAARISGSRFAYFMGPLVELQFGLIQFVLAHLTDEAFIASVISDYGIEGLTATSFTPVLPPMMMRTEAYEATGRLKAEDVTYKLAEDDAWLIGSAEHSLCSMYAGEILPAEQLPIRYIGYSTSFRREAGTYGKDTNGIIRMHHFDKLEMEVFSNATTSRAEHELLIAIQEGLLKKLGLHYQVVLKCTADIGDPNARGVDINTWFPGQNAFRETHSADYMTDFQARGLNTRYRDADGATAFVHTNDATAFAMGRIMAAIVEQYQTSEAKVRIPEALRPFLAGREEL